MATVDVVNGSKTSDCLERFVHNKNLFPCDYSRLEYNLWTRYLTRTVSLFSDVPGYSRRLRKAYGFQLESVMDIGIFIYPPRGQTIRDRLFVLSRRKCLREAGQIPN